MSRNLNRKVPEVDIAIGPQFGLNLKLVFELFFGYISFSIKIKSHSVHWCDTLVAYNKIPQIHEIICT